MRVFNQVFLKFCNRTVSYRIAQFLFQCSSTTHTTTAVPPAELLLGRRLWIKVDSILHDVSQWVTTSQLRPEVNHDNYTRDCYLQQGNKVFIRNSITAGKRYLSGTILSQSEPVSFKIKLNDERIFHWHIDHLKLQFTWNEPTRSTENDFNKFVPQQLNATAHAAILSIFING